MFYFKSLKERMETPYEEETFINPIDSQKKYKSNFSLWIYGTS